MVSLAAAAPAKAQVSLSVNIGLQPDWGPRGYDHVDYYYLPDVDCYYYVPTRQYVYLSGNSWVHRRYLPARYRGYDLYGGRKVVINSPRPWMHHNTYRTRYVSRGYARPSRVVVRNNYRVHNSYRGPKNRGYDRREFNRGNSSRNKYQASRVSGNHGGPRGGHDRGHDRGGRGHH